MTTGVAHDAETAEPTVATPRAVPRWRVVLRIVLAVGLTALAVWAVTGKTSELSGAGKALARVSWTWIAVAALAETASILAFAAVPRRLLSHAGLALPLSTMTGLTLASTALQNSLPAGPAVSNVYIFREYRRRGATSIAAVWTLVASGGLMLGALVVLAVGGATAARATASDLDLAGALTVTGVVVAIGVAGAVLLRYRTVPARVLGFFLRLSQRTLRRPRCDVDAIVRRWSDAVLHVQPGWRGWTAAFVLGLCNWLGDCMCFAAAFVAIHSAVPWRGLFLAYGAAQLAAALPITIGGLGVVEGSLALGLVAYGGGHSSTVAAVFAYRLLSFWIQIPIGWALLGWFVLRRRRADRDALAEVSS